MPHTSEAITVIERHIRHGAAIVAGILATGGNLAEMPVSAAQATVPEARISVVHPLPNVSFGLSGLPLIGPDSSLLKSQAMSALSGFNGSIRVAVHESNLPESREVIKAARAEAVRLPGDQRLIVSTTETDSDVNQATRSQACGGHEPLKKPGQKPLRNHHFNLASCLKNAERLENHNLGILMRENPDITIWTAQNEPENGSQPSNVSEGGPGFAVRQYVIAAKIATLLNHRQVIAAGEFWNFPSSYDARYYSLLALTLKQLDMEMPQAEALHPYKGIVCNTAQQQLRAAEKEMQRVGLLNAARHGYGLVLTEVGIPLQTHEQCANAIALSNGKLKNPTTMTPADIIRMTKAQQNAAMALMKLGNFDPRMPITAEDLYDPLTPAYKCWGGGPWDSATNSFVDMWGMTHTLADGLGAPELPRPELYVFNGQPLPSYLLKPRTVYQMRLAEKVLVTASHWPKSRTGNCTVDIY